MRRKKANRPWIPKREPSRNKGTDPFYLSVLWRKIRHAVLRDEPACRVCRIYHGTPKRATVLDHFRPRRLWDDLALVISNLVPMCDHCHARKTGMEKYAKTRHEWEQKVLPKFKLCDGTKG